MPGCTLTHLSLGISLWTLDPTTCGSGRGIQELWHELFGLSKSGTYSSKPGTAFEIDYSTGIDTDRLANDSQSVPGKWVTDNVGIGNLTDKGQQLVLASSCPSFLQDVPFGGVMGIGRVGYTQTPNQRAWYWSLYDDNNATHSKISFFYPPGNVRCAEVTIGGVNLKRYTGEIR